MPGQAPADPGGYSGVFDRTDGEAVVPDHPLTRADHVGPGALRPLIRQRKALQMAIEWLLSTIEQVGIVGRAELLYRRTRARARCHSNTLFSASNRAK